jgi:hypothetical protein
MLLETPEVAKRSIVDVIKERNFIHLTERKECLKQQVVKVRASGNPELRPLDGYWAVVTQVHPFTYQVCISVKSASVHCKEEEVEYLDLDEAVAKQLRSISERIKTLLECNLETVDYAILETMQRSVYLTPRQFLYLEMMEKDYGVVTNAVGNK